jgi:hypothetical protein
MTACYVPKHLTEFQKADDSWLNHAKIGRKPSNSAWVARDDLPTTVVRHNRFSPTTLFSIFFKSTGPVLIHYVE